MFDYSSFEISYTIRLPKKIFFSYMNINDLPIKVFNCTIFVHILSKFQSKLNPKVEKYVFIGYAPDKK
jgi:hypothetical protein